MRERMGHEEWTDDRFDVGIGGWRGDVAVPTGRPARRRRAAGPRPVRPRAVPVAVRPLAPPRPVEPVGRPVADELWSVGGLRLLGRPAARPPRYRLRRLVAGLALAAVSAAAVVALGLLARATAPPEPVAAPVSAVAAPVVVTAGAGETVWEVVDRVAPGLPGPERAALAERIVVDNGLPSARLRPGQQLRVTVG